MRSANEKNNYFSPGTEHEDDDNVIFVVYTVRLIKDAEYYRIISARAAEKEEVQAYKEVRKLAENW